MSLDRISQMVNGTINFLKIMDTVIIGYPIVSHIRWFKDDYLHHILEA